MEQLELFDIPNPCINICETNTSGYCKGCFRNRIERLNWNNLNNIQKSKILKKCRFRKLKSLKNFQIKTTINQDQYQLKLFEN